MELQRILVCLPIFVLEGGPRRGFLTLLLPVTEQVPIFKQHINSCGLVIFPPRNTEKANKIKTVVME